MNAFAPEHLIQPRTDSVPVRDAREPTNCAQFVYLELSGASSAARRPYHTDGRFMIRAFFLLLALLVGPGIVHGQNAGSIGQDEDPGPVLILLRLTDELSLTSRQIGALERIDREMDRQNEPHLERLREIRDGIRALGNYDELGEERRKRFDEYIAEARHLVDEIRANNLTAMRRVGNVLTDAQKERLAAILRERDGNRERSSDNSRVPGRP